MHYFKYREDEFPREDCEGWIWYECDDRGYAKRKLICLDDGRRFKYDEKHFLDDFDMLADQPLTRRISGDLVSETAPVSKEEFESAWSADRR